MQTLMAGQFVDLWESGQGQRWPTRADLLLTAARPDLSPEARSALRVGERDLALLDFRRRQIGPKFDVLTDCPACGESLEITVQAEDLAAGMSGGESVNSIPALTGPAADDTRGVFELGEVRLFWRVPTSGDFLALEATGSAQALRDGILARCVEARRDDQVVDLPDLPEDVVVALSRAFEQADPAANVELMMSCPACGHRFTAFFDVVRHLWSEVEDLTRGLLQQVHRLARAYGWSESEILSLSHARRQIYLAQLT